MSINDFPRRDFLSEIEFSTTSNGSSSGVIDLASNPSSHTLSLQVGENMKGVGASGVLTLESPNIGSRTLSGTQRFGIADNIGTSLGSTPYTLSCSIFLEDVDTDQTIIGKWQDQGGSESLEYRILYDSSVRSFKFETSSDGTTSEYSITSSAPVSLNTWYFLLAEHTSVASDATFRVNDYSDSTTIAADTFNGTANFVVGGELVPEQRFLQGKVSRAALWKRVLTSLEKSFLYNAGAGRPFSEVGTTNTFGEALQTSLIAYWEGGELAGSLVDLHGSNELVENFNTSSALPSILTDFGPHNEGFAGFRIKEGVDEFVIGQNDYINLVEGEGITLGLINEGSGVSATITATGATEAIERIGVKGLAGCATGDNEMVIINNQVNYIAGDGVSLEGSFTSASGSTGGLRTFDTLLDSQHFTRTTNTSLEMGDQDFTIFGWYNTPLSPFSTLIFSKGLDSPNREYHMRYSGGTLEYDFSSDGSSRNTIASLSEGVTTDKWLFIIAEHDSVNDLVTIQVNNGETIGSGTFVGGPFVGTEDFSIGRKENAEFMDGSVSRFGLATTLFTTEQKTTLYNYGLGLHYTQLPTDIKTNLVSYWNLDESSGNALDAHSTNDLTETTDSAAIPGSQSEQFGIPAASVEITSLPTGSRKSIDNSSYLRGNASGVRFPGHQPFSITGWLRSDDLISNTFIMGTQGENSSFENQFWFDYTISGSSTLNTRKYHPRFRVSDDGTTSSVTSVTSDYSVERSQWDFLHAYHDPDTDVIGIQINDQEIFTTTFSTGLASGSGSLSLFGSPISSTNNIRHLSKVGLWRKLLTSQELTFLYNGGNGRNYSELGINSTNGSGTKLALEAYYNLDEACGSGLDSHFNAIHLAEPLTSSVPSSYGPENLNYSSFFIRDDGGTELPHYARTILSASGGNGITSEIGTSPSGLRLGYKIDNTLIQNLVLSSSGNGGVVGDTSISFGSHATPNTFEFVAASGMTIYNQGDGKIAFESAGGGGGGGTGTSWTITDGSTSQTIDDGDTLNVTSGTGIAAFVSATDTLTINISDAVPTKMLLTSDGGTQTGDSTVNFENHPTSNAFGIVAGGKVSIVGDDAAGTLKISASGTHLILAGDTGSSSLYFDDTLTIAGGTGIDTSVTGQTLTVEVGTSLISSTSISASGGVQGGDASIAWLNNSVDNTSSLKARPGIELYGDNTNGDLYIGSDDKVPHRFLLSSSGTGAVFDTSTIEVDDNSTPNAIGVIAGNNITFRGLLDGSFAIEGTAGGGGSFNDFSITDGDTTSFITDGETIHFVGGTGIDAFVTDASPTGIVTFNVNDSVARVVRVGSDVGLAIGDAIVNITNHTSDNSVEFLAGENITLEGRDVNGQIVINASGSTSPSYSFSIRDDSLITQEITNGDILDFNSGNGITNSVSATDQLTTSINDSVAQKIVVSATGTGSATGTASTIFFDDYFTSNAFNLVASDGIELGVIDGLGQITIKATGVGTFDDFTIIDDALNTSIITDGEKLEFAEGNGILPVVSDAAGTGIITFNINDSIAQNIAISATGTGSIVGTTTNPVLIDSHITANTLGFVAGDGITIIGNSDGTISFESSAGGGTMNSIIIRGDGAVSSTITDGETIQYTGGNGLTSSVTNASPTGTVTFDINDTIAQNIALTGNAFGTTTVTIDSHPTPNTFGLVGGADISLTGDGTGKITIASTANMDTFNIFDGSTAQTISDGQTITFVDGTGINATVSATRNVTIAANDVAMNFSLTGSATGDASVSVSSHLSTNTIGFVGGTNITLTGDNVNGLITIDSTGGGSFSDFIISDTNTPTPNTQTIDDGETITFADGNGINAVVSATNTVTHSINDSVAQKMVLSTNGGTQTGDATINFDSHATSNAFGLIAGTAIHLVGSNAAGTTEVKLKDAVSLTVVTDVQVTGNTLQKKTRTITAANVGAESAWTTFHTGATC